MQGFDGQRAVESVASVVAANVEQAETDRGHPRSTIDALIEAGLMRMCVPVVYGGPEVDPPTLLRTIESLAAIDGAAGWLAMISSTTSTMALFLEPAVAREIFADRCGVWGGVFAPGGTGARVDGGWTVTGRWQWGSGTTNCTWITGGTTTDDGEFRLMFLPHDLVTIHDTWYSLGLRGTGSHDFSVKAAFVPDGRSIQPMTGRRQLDCALARFPNFTLLGAAIAACALGIGRRAIDEAIDLTRRKTPTFSQRTVAQHALTLVELPSAEAALSSARAFLLDEVESAWQHALAGDEVSVAGRVRIRLAGINAAQQAARATDIAYTVSGGSAVYLSSPLQRCLRDAHTATQHLMVSPRVLETVGKVMLGAGADTTML